jgi:hypothetical protein
MHTNNIWKEKNPRQKESLVNSGLYGTTWKCSRLVYTWLFLNKNGHELWSKT